MKLEKKKQDISPFLGPLVPLFQTSSDISPDFESQDRAPHLSALLAACDGYLRFTSGVIPTHLQGNQHGNQSPLPSYCFHALVGVELVSQSATSRHSD